MSQIPMEQGESQDWDAFFSEMTDAYMRALEQNVTAQSAFVESWTRTLEESVDEDVMTEGFESYARAYEVWMNAADTVSRQLSDAFEGEAIDAIDFRDVWLDAANEAFKEVMGTSAFAAATGESVERALDVRQQVDESAEETLHALGFATVGDSREIGERIVELERRQQRIEEKLEDVLAALE